MMVHVFPNYSFPYEPHFGIPLIPGAPRLTGRLLVPRIARSEVWRALNFVTVRQVDRAAGGLGLIASYPRNLMAESVRRVAVDAQFRARQPAPVRAVAALLRGPVSSLLDLVPRRLRSPQLVVLRQPGRPDTARGGSR
jgi:hypothetical protein